ncbi:MAG: LemA family protein [Candidatus Omnitrophica bacterium]|nr:LemA family protein [Candidatus Omnitrophota bacterium]
MYNRLVRNRALVKEAWSGIDVQLKRRHDLIPNLVETVKGYMQHEKTVLENVTDLRSRLMGTTDPKERMQMEQGLTQALKTIFALSEAYPELKASEGFLKLQDNLREIEEQIQMARRYYNGSARNYNIMTQSFPSTVIARWFRFDPVEYFEIESATERAVPDVNFNQQQ